MGASVLAAWSHPSSITPPDVYSVLHLQESFLKAVISKLVATGSGLTAGVSALYHVNPITSSWPNMPCSVLATTLAVLTTVLQELELVLEGQCTWEICVYLVYLLAPAGTTSCLYLLLATRHLCEKLSWQQVTLMGEIRLC